MTSEGADTAAFSGTVTRSVDKQEMEVAFSGPALGVNRFFVTAGPHGVRIAFTEVPPGEGEQARFRSAVLMTVADAMALAELLNTMARAQADGQ